MIADFRNPTDLVRGLWKHKLWILLPLVVGVAISQVVIRLVTPVYSASTVVMVEPQKVPAAYVRTTVTSELRDRLKTLEQEIKKRSTMEKLIGDADLFPDDRDFYPMEELVVWARNNLTVSVERGKLVRISFVSTDPFEASRAANEVAKLFIEENLNLREKQAENTTGFLNTELARTKEQLEEQESRVSEFRLRNGGSLPSQREANLAAIAQLERVLDQNRAETEDAELRRFLIMREGEPEIQEVLAAPSPQKARLQKLELELKRLRSQFTDKHPDVVRLQSEIESLRVRENLRQVNTAPIVVQSEPDEIDLEVAASETELTRLAREREEIMRDISRYQSRLEATPRVEQQLISLTRDYDNLSKSYQSMLSKLIEARLAEELERQQQSEQFRILELASPPGSPAYPNRFMFNIVGLVLGGGAGVGIAFLREYLDETFSDETIIRRAFPGVDTVISIPHIPTDVSNEGDIPVPREERSA